MSTGLPVDVVETKKEEGMKYYKCMICTKERPRTEYTKKQLKKKGKRRCNECLSWANRKVDTNLQRSSVLAKETRAIEAMVNQNAELKSNESPDDDKFDVLISWLKKGGSKFPALYLKYYAIDYRGVHANRRIENKEIILEVPHKQIMTSEKAKESEIGQAIIKNRVRLRSTHSYLACYLLTERLKGKESYWSPYIDILPVHFRNKPVFFDQDELMWLKGSFSLQMLSNRKDSLKAEYDNICKSVPSFKQFRLEEFIWARCSVITRIFGFKIDNYKTDGLVPMADMLNHKIPNETTWQFDQQRYGFTITSTRRLLKGSQIFDSYGRKCNSRFFVNYGFSLTHNIDNQVAMYFQLEKPESKEMESVYAIKSHYISTSKRRYQIPLLHTEKVSQKCYSFVRLLVATEQELKDIIPQVSKVKNFTEKVGAITPRNELAMLKMIHDKAVRTLASFDCDIDEDNRLLNDEKDKLTMNIRNAILMRRGEKYVLHYYIDLYKYVSEWAEKEDASAFRKRLKRHHNDTTMLLDAHPKVGLRRFNLYLKAVWEPLMRATRGPNGPVLPKDRNYIAEAEDSDSD